MKLENLHAHMHINALANGSAEVLFMGQPALSVVKTAEDSYCWVISHVFAKLTYGANVIGDVPYCNSLYTSIEHAAAEGMAKLEELGAFKTIAELPEDTYSNAKKLVDDDILSHAIESNHGKLVESIKYVTALRLGTLKPSTSFTSLQEKVQAGEQLSESEQVARFEYARMGKHIFSGTLVEAIEEVAQEVVEEASETAPANETRQVDAHTLFEQFKAKKLSDRIDESRRLVSTHDSGAKERTAKVYKCSESGEHIVKFFQDGKHQTEADYHTDDKHDAQGTAKHWISQLKVDEALNDDDYYVVNPETKTVVSRLGKPVKKVAMFTDPSEHPEFKSSIKDPKHKVMRGMAAKHAGFLQEATRSEFDANQMMSGTKTPEAKKSVRIIGPTGATVAKLTSRKDAEATFIMKKFSTKTHTIKEDCEDGSEIDLTSLFEEIEADYDKWMAKVKAKHGDKKYNIRHRIEKGVHTSSAEVPGQDRSYAVYDHDKNEGHIFEESEAVVGEEILDERELTDAEVAKKEEIVAALKGRKGFTSRFGKDVISAVANQMAKTAGA
jgi:hypothetical protein